MLEDLIRKNRYWRDSRGAHHVPKQSLKDIVIEAYD